MSRALRGQKQSHLKLKEELSVAMKISMALLTPPGGERRRRGCPSKLAIEPRCSVPCDHVPVRSWPLFRAREVMAALIKSLAQEQRS